MSLYYELLLTSTPYGKSYEEKIEPKLNKGQYLCWKSNLRCSAITNGARLKIQTKEAIFLLATIRRPWVYPQSVIVATLIVARWLIPDISTINIMMMMKTKV